MNTLEEYGELFQRLGLTELAVKEGDCELILKKEVNVVAAPEIEHTTQTSATAQTLAKTETIKNDDALIEICAPLVGVFYAAESPGEEPFVKEGTHVKKGDIVCRIEAMKMYNDVTADMDGIITEVCVNNAQLVEYNQVLFRMSPAEE